MNSNRTALFVSSSGGVLLDLLALEGRMEGFSTQWAVVEAPDTLSALAGRPVRWIPDLSLKSPGAMLASIWGAYRLLRTLRPALIVSAGSGPAFPFFLAARLLGVPTFWLSTLNIHDREGLTARLCVHLATRVFVQQPTLLHSASRGIVIGELY